MKKSSFEKKNKCKQGWQKRTETSCGCQHNALLHPYFTLMCNSTIAECNTWRSCSAMQTSAVDTLGCILWVKVIAPTLDKNHLQMLSLRGKGLVWIRWYFFTTLPLVKQDKLIGMAADGLLQVAMAMDLGSINTVLLFRCFFLFYLQ